MLPSLFVSCVAFLFLFCFCFLTESAAALPHQSGGTLPGVVLPGLEHSRKRPITFFFFFLMSLRMPQSRKEVRMGSKLIKLPWIKNSVRGCNYCKMPAAVPSTFRAGVRRGETCGFGRGVDGSLGVTCKMVYMDKKKTNIKTEEESFMMHVCILTNANL